MLEPDERLPETLENPAVFDLVAVEMFLPEFARAFRRSVRRGGNLPGTLAARYPFVRKRGRDGADLGVGVGVVEMIVGVAAVKQHRLFDEPLTKNLGAEIDIFLGAGGAQSDVMQPLDDGICHNDPPNVDVMLTPLDCRVNGRKRGRESFYVF